jgi:hypothetical protein
LSFSLLTAINVEDVPRILKRCASGYRTYNTDLFAQTWKLIADEMDEFAGALSIKIAEAKLREPPPKRKRIRL